MATSEADDPLARFSGELTMPNDSPSPLALAREAAETAREEFWATRLRQAQVGSAVYPPAHNRLQQAREKMDRAIRAEREALVEATLRWQKRNPGYHHVGRCIYNDSADVLTMADVLKQIEEGR